MKRAAKQRGPGRARFAEMLTKLKAAIDAGVVHPQRDELRALNVLCQRYGLENPLPTGASARRS